MSGPHQSDGCDQDNPDSVSDPPVSPANKKEINVDKFKNDKRTGAYKGADQAAKHTQKEKQKDGFFFAMEWMMIWSRKSTISAYKISCLPDAKRTAGGNGEG